MKTLPKLNSTNTGMSKRVSLAVKRLRNDSSSIETNNPKSVDSKILTSTVPNDIDKKRKRNRK